MMFQGATRTALLLAGGVFCIAGQAQTLLFEEKFDSPDFSHKWVPSGSGGVYDPAENAVRITSSKPGGDYLVCDLDAASLRGKRIQFEALVKGQGLSQSKTPFFNSKLKISFDSLSPLERYPEAKRKSGTYDWWRAVKVAHIPEDASNCKFTIGLQDVTGSYWVKDLKIYDIPSYAGQPYVPSAEPLQKTPKYRGVDTARLNGWSEQDFIDLRKWNVNIVRYQMVPFATPIKTREQFSAWIDLEIKKIDAFLALARKYGVKAVIDLQVGPGSDNSELGSNRISWDPKDQALLVDTWRKLATHFKGDKAIYAYDLLNEPRETDYVYSKDGGVEWQLLCERTIKAIREIDPDTPILVEATCWSNPEGFELLKPVNGRNLIYSPHFYEPHSYTHQGIINKTTFNYPGLCDGKVWDKEQLRKAMAPVVEFQRKYNVPIFIGEFSVAAWGEGADRWLKDVIDLFEENGWDWCYHSFREYGGWSLEHEGVPGKFSPSSDNARKRVMLDFFQRNAKE